MCSKIETKEAVYEALSEENEQGKNIIEEHIEHAGRDIVSRLTMRFGIAFVSLVIAAAGTWYALYYQVQRIDSAQEELYSKQQAALLEYQIQQNQRALETVITRDDFNEFKEAFIRLDERLRNKGI